MADTDRQALRIIQEGTFAVLPTGDVTGTVSTVQATKTYSIAAGFDAFATGQVVLFAGFVNADSNGYKTVVSATATDIVVKEAIGADELSVAGVTAKVAMENMRYTGEGMKQETDTQNSAEITDDGQIACVKRTNISATGEVNVETSFGGVFDKLFTAGIRTQDFSDAVSDTQITFSFVAADNSVNDSGSGFVTAGFLANQWYQLSGTLNGLNDGLYKAVSVAAGKIVLAGRTVVDESAGESITIEMGEQAVNGTTLKTFAIEKDNTDLSNVFAHYLGTAVSEFSVTAESEAMLTGTFSFLGKKEISAAATGSKGTPLAAPTVCPMSAIDDVEGILEAMADRDATQFSFTVTNNIRSRNEIGELGATSLGLGKIEVSGTVQMYFEDQVIMDKYLNFTSTSLVLKTEDEAGNVYIFDFPQVVYTDGAHVAGGENQDIIADMSFMAYRNATEDVTVRIARFAA